MQLEVQYGEQILLSPLKFRDGMRWIPTLLLLSSCSVAVSRDVGAPTPPEMLGTVVLGFTAPGGHGDVSIGGNLFKEPPRGLSRTTDGLLYLTYQLMPYPRRLRRSNLPLLSPGFSVGYAHRLDTDHNLLLSGNLEANFLRYYGREAYDFGQVFLAVRYRVLFPMSGSGLRTGVSLELGYRGAWWKAPW